MGSVLAMGGARAQVVKRAPIVEKERPVKPWDVQLRDIWRKNKFACVSLAVLAVSWLAVLWFSRTHYIKSWAYSQGLNFFVDFEEEQFMIYREYTIEPSEYSAALELGKAILSRLPSRLDVNATIKKDQDVSAFVSKREPAK